MGISINKSTASSAGSCSACTRFDTKGKPVYEAVHVIMMDHLVVRLCNKCLEELFTKSKYTNLIMNRTRKRDLDAYDYDDDFDEG